MRAASCNRRLAPGQKAAGGPVAEEVRCLCGSKSGGRAPPGDQVLPDLQAWFTGGRKGDA